jgi:hypothetical protein
MTNSQTSCDFNFNLWGPGGPRWTGAPTARASYDHRPLLQVMTTGDCDWTTGARNLYRPVWPRNRPVISCHDSHNGSRVLNRLWPEMPVLGSSWLARRPGEVLGGGGEGLGEDGLWFQRDEETLGSSFLSLALAAMAEWEELSLLGCEYTAPCLLVAFNGWKRIFSWAVVEGICQDRVFQDLSVVDGRRALGERELYFGGEMETWLSYEKDARQENQIWMWGTPKWWEIVDGCVIAMACWNAQQSEDHFCCRLSFCVWICEYFFESLWSVWANK